MIQDDRYPPRLLLATLFVAATAALVVFWLPQFGGRLQTDVTWIYRIQTTPAASIPSVPEGLRLFSGAPMGWVEACKAHLEAFRRLNCGDITLWRASAILAGDSLHWWLAISLAFNTLAICLLGYVLWALGTAWLLALAALVGLFVVPSEIWVSAVTSESRVFLAFAAALAAAASGRHWLAALSMLAMVAFKEPSFVWWPLVSALSLCSGSLAGRRRKGEGPHDARTEGQSIQLSALVPHLAVGTLAVAVFVLLWVLVKARNDYPFLLKTPYPEPVSFLIESLGGMLPPVVHGPKAFVFSLIAGALLVGSLWMGGRLGRLASEYRMPRTWLVIAAALLGIAGHLAVHWLTRRTIGDTRYVVPANIGLLLALLALLNPAVSLSSRSARVAAGLVLTAGLLLSFPWKDKPVVGLGLVGAAGGLLLAVAFASIAGTVRSRWKVASVAGLATGFLVAPPVDSGLNQGAAAVADSRAWSTTAEELIASLPPRAYVNLRTSDALMIETAWSLQAEFLFAKRGDVEFWLTPLDTSFFDKEGGLVRAANELFNVGRMTSEEASREARPLYELHLDRSGSSQSGKRPSATAAGVVAAIATDPAGFFRHRYLDWRSGYLVAKLEKAS